MLSQLEMVMETKPEEYLTTAQVAKILGVSIPSVNLWVKAGDFPNAFRINPRTHSPWRIPRSDVDAFIERRTRKRGYFYVPPKSQN